MSFPPHTGMEGILRADPCLRWRLTFPVIRDEPIKSPRRTRCHGRGEDDGGAITVTLSLARSGHAGDDGSSE